METGIRTLYVAGVRSASSEIDDQCNAFWRGVDVVIDVTAVPGTDTVTFTIEGKDQASGKYYTLLASAALVATGTVVLRVYPGLAVAVNASANAVLPRTWRVKVEHSAATDFTYSVGANLHL